MPDLSTEPCLCASLRRAARAATRLYDEQMRASGLKVTQFSLLRNIGRAGTINVTELARKVDLERTAMGRNLDVLEKRGLIHTGVAQDDARERTVTLTAAGRRAEAAALPVWRAAQTEMKRRLRAGKLGSLEVVFALAGR